MRRVDDLRVKVFADGADAASIIRLNADPVIKGFTTNPSLMHKAGISDYEQFARSVLAVVNEKPISFEVIADDLPSMVRQAKTIAAWGKNVYVKIPVTNTKGVFCGPVIAELSASGIAVNVTAILTLEQVRAAAECIAVDTPAIVSVLAGRIADTGRDPVPFMAQAAAILKSKPRVELLWASPRELLNVFHADIAGCDIITVTKDLLKKLPLVSKDLSAYSLETVRELYRDSTAAGLTIDVPDSSADQAAPAHVVP